MHLLYGTTDGNSREARRRYRELFPNRRLPNYETFAAVDRHMREYGICDVSRSGRPQLHGVTVEDNILQLFDDGKTISTRCISASVGISQTSVRRLIRRQQLLLVQPFHLQKVNDLLSADYPRRQQFCQWLLQQHKIDLTFIRRVLFTHKTLFICGGIINAHKMHMWAYENPHTTTVRGYQCRFSVNVLCGIVGNYELGPHVLPPRLTGSGYRQFVEHELPGLLHEDVPLATRNSMWFMHDGAPHISVTWPGSISMLHIPIGGRVVQNQLLGQPDHRT